MRAKNSNVREFADNFLPEASWQQRGRILADGSRPDHACGLGQVCAARFFFLLQPKCNHAGNE